MRITDEMVDTALLAANAWWSAQPDYTPVTADGGKQAMRVALEAVISNNHPRTPAAHINALIEEGTREELCEWLQKQWNEIVALRSRPEPDAVQVTETEAGVEEPERLSPDAHCNWGGDIGHERTLRMKPDPDGEYVRLSDHNTIVERLKWELADLKHDIERAQNALSLEATARIEAEENGARLSGALNRIASLHMATTLGTHSRARYDLNRARSIACAALRELKGGE